MATLVTKTVHSLRLRSWKQRPVEHYYQQAWQSVTRPRCLHATSSVFRHAVASQTAKVSAASEKATKGPGERGSQNNNGRVDVEAGASATGSTASALPVEDAPDVALQTVLYQPGDLVEVSIKGVLYLGVIIPSPLTPPSMLNAVFLNGRESYFMRYSVRFHAPGFIPADECTLEKLYPADVITTARKPLWTITGQENGTAATGSPVVEPSSLSNVNMSPYKAKLVKNIIQQLRAFEELSAKILRDALPLFHAVTEKHGKRSNVIWMVNEFAQESFASSDKGSQEGAGQSDNTLPASNVDSGQEISPAMLHAAYRFLFYNTRYFVKPPYIKSNGPYFQRCASELELLQKLDLLKTQNHACIESLRRKLSKGFAEASKNLQTKGLQEDLATPWSPVQIDLSLEEGYFVEAMRHYSCSHWMNDLHNPYLPYIRMVTSGIVDFRSSDDLLYFMTRLGFLPKNFNMHTYQSCFDLKESPDIVNVSEQLAQEVDFVRQTSLKEEEGIGVEEVAQADAGQGSVPSSSLFVRVINAMDHVTRTDFDDMVCFTIDSPSTMDVDDALSLEITPDGQEWIHVHIADPTALIPFNSDIEKHARYRTSSVYNPEETFPMLVSSLGDQISLEPGRPNLTMTHSFRVASNGDIEDIKITPGIIRNIVKLSYEQADLLLGKTTRQVFNHVYPEDRLTLSPFPAEHVAYFGPILKRLYEMAEKLRDFRIASGHVSFDLPEAVVVVAQDKHTILNVFNEQEEKAHSELLVSELMVSAGRAAAQWAHARKIVIPYRTQPCPTVLPSYIQDPIADVRAIPKDDYVKLFDLPNFFSISKMKLTPDLHWSMGISHYTRTTSPMRRYTDMLVHYQMKSFLLREASPLTASCTVAEGTSHGSAASVKNVAPPPLMTMEQLTPLVNHINAMEPKIKYLQKRANKFWVLTHMSNARNNYCAIPGYGKDLVVKDEKNPYHGMVLSILSPGLVNVYVTELFSCFYIKEPNLPASLQPGDTLSLLPLTISRSNINVRWIVVGSSAAASSSSSLTGQGSHAIEATSSTGHVRTFSSIFSPHMNKISA